MSSDFRLLKTDVTNVPIDFPLVYDADLPIKCLKYDQVMNLTKYLKNTDAKAFYDRLERGAGDSSDDEY